MNKIYIIPLYLLLLLTGCKSKENKTLSTEQEVVINDPASSYSSEEANEDIEYEDGEYCATIEYYNPKTGTSSTYTLTVEVENGELSQINWPNGGWLDDTHFSRPTIETDGSCSFTTYDGKSYDIQIDEEGSCSGSSKSPNDDDDEYYEEQRLKKQQQQEEEDNRQQEEEREG